jgi:hypothetical protein
MWIMMTMQARASRPQNNAANNPIYVTSQDKQRLKDLLMEVEVSDRRTHDDPEALSEELHRAVVVAPKDSAERL